MQPDYRREEIVLPLLIAERAGQAPDQLLLVDVEGGSFTYRELHERARLWSRALMHAGVGPGSTIVTMLHNTVENYAVWFGIAWAGAIEVPINVDLRGAVLTHQLNTARATIVITDPSARANLEAIAAAVSTLHRLIVVPDAGAVAAAGAANGLATVTSADLLATAPAEPARPYAELHSWDVATVMYTSGTTGPSKGVLMPWAQLHSGTLLSSAGVAGGPGEKKVMYVTGPPNHVQAKGAVATMARLGGTTLLRHAFSSSRFWAEVREHHVTDVGLIGAMAQFLLSQPPRPDDADTTLGNVLMAPVVPAVDEFNSRFGTRVWSAYNMTELSVPTWLAEWHAGEPPNCGVARQGYPYYELRIVDEHDFEVEPGAVGELIVRTGAPWTLSAGYLNMPEATVAAWRNGWFHTGDAFRKDEQGRFFFVDRMKDTIRRRGENVSSFEVEAEVARHPAVRECAAIAVPADEAEDEIKIVVVRRTGSDLGGAELAAYLTQRLPKFMVPRYVQFVDELPKTPTLRVQKGAVSRTTRPSDGVWDRADPSTVAGRS